MRAAQYHRYGDPSVIAVHDVPVPVPARGEVLVRVGATTVNGGELAGRAGSLRLLSGRRFPKGLGLDFAGEVEALGDGVADVAVGDRVWGLLDPMRTTVTQQPTGAAAEHLVVASGRTAPVPGGLSLVDAAALLTGTTALTALRDKAHLQAGERLLVRGGTGGVGYVALQLGRALGAHVTTLVSARNLEVARSLGADVALDRSTTAARDLGQFDVILDVVGSRLHSSHRHLSASGRMVAVALDPPLRGLAVALASTVHGRRRIRVFHGNPTRALLGDYARFVEDGQLRALVARTYALEETGDAHRAVAVGGVPGKHVIVLGEPGRPGWDGDAERGARGGAPRVSPGAPGG